MTANIASAAGHQNIHASLMLQRADAPRNRCQELRAHEMQTQQRPGHPGCGDHSEGYNIAHTAAIRRHNFASKQSYKRGRDDDTAFEKKRLPADAMDRK